MESDGEVIEKLTTRIEHLESEIERHEKNAALSKTLLRISALSFDEQLTIDALYVEVHKELENIIDASNFYIARVMDNGQRLRFSFFKDTYGLRLEHAHDFPVRPYGGGLTEILIDGGETLLLSHDDIAHMNVTGIISPRNNLAESWLGAPLSYNNTAIGAIVVQSYTKRVSFTKADAEIFEFVSHHIAAAIARHENQKLLERSATIDSLTGLLNRAALMDKLRKVAESTSPNLLASVLFIDLDGFKDVNDNFGHELGDKVLQQVALTMQNTVREVDDVSRFGGDEFVILMNRIQDRVDSITVAERLIETFNHPILVDDQSVEIGVSIGIAYAEDGAESAETLLNEADSAMYCAKRNGKSQYRVAGQNHVASDPERG